MIRRPALTAIARVRVAQLVRQKIHPQPHPFIMPHIRMTREPERQWRQGHLSQNLRDARPLGSHADMCDPDARARPDRFCLGEDRIAAECEVGGGQVKPKRLGRSDQRRIAVESDKTMIC